MQSTLKGASLPKLDEPLLQGKFREKKSQSLLSNDFYSVYIHETKGIVITDKDGKPVVASLRGVIEYSTASQGAIRESLRLDCGDMQFVPGKPGSSLVINYKSSVSNLEVRFEFNEKTPKILVKTTASYKKDLQLTRESLVFFFVDACEEIFSKDRRINRPGWKNLYWLDRQGARIGKGKRCLLLYHAPQISSLQLNLRKKQLWVNLDFSKDHPHIGDDPNGTWKDLSSSCFKKGQKRINSFSFWVGRQPGIMPRLMLHPGGYLASYVFTEHACYTDFRIHKAVYYGSEDIDSPCKASGGFVKHRIPVTKSVFYANTSGEKNDSQSDIFKGEMVSIKGNPEFLKYLQDLHSLGIYEICLHCVQPSTSKVSFAREGVRFMKENFDMVSWIDHIWFKPNGLTTGCCDAFMHKGLEKGSACMSEIWSENGTRYFWNPAPEYMKYNMEGRPSLKKMLFEGKWLRLIQEMRLRKKLTGTCSSNVKGLNLHTDTNHIPDPLYWRHPTRTYSFISWASIGVPRFSKQDKSHSKPELEKLIRRRGVCFSHGYPTYIGTSNGAWKMNEQGKVVIEAAFDALLERLSRRREAGELNMATIRDILDYWLKLENIEMDYMPDGSVCVTNTGLEPIKGLSLAICGGSSVCIDGREMRSKTSDADTIVWFDIEAQESLRIIPRLRDF